MDKDESDSDEAAAVMRSRVDPVLPSVKYARVITLRPETVVVPPAVPTVPLGSAISLRNLRAVAVLPIPAACEWRLLTELRPVNHEPSLCVATSLHSFTFSPVVAEAAAS